MTPLTLSPSREVSQPALSPGRCTFAISLCTGVLVPLPPCIPLCWGCPRRCFTSKHFTRARSYSSLRRQASYSVIQVRYRPRITCRRSIKLVMFELKPRDLSGMLVLVIWSNYAWVLASSRTARTRPETGNLGGQQEGAIRGPTAFMLLMHVILL